MKVASSFISILCALSAATARPTARLLPPSQNVSKALSSMDLAFFGGKYNLENAENGAILYSRTISSDKLPYSIPSLGAYQIMYKSYDPIRKRAFATPATIFVPPTSPGAAGQNASMQNNIIVRAVSYDSPNVACGSSYSAVLDPTGGPDMAGVELIRMALLSNRTIVFPDWSYDGFLVGPMTGNAILDSIRAVLNFKQVVPRPEMAAVGLEAYSGGSNAIAWAMQSQPKYAPELKSVIKGAVIGGLPSNYTRDILKLDGQLSSGLVAMAVIGLYNTFDSVRAYLEPRLTDHGRAMVEFVQSQCLYSVLLQYPFMRFFEDNTNVTREEALQDPAVASVIDSLTLGFPGSDSPQVPIRLYSSLTDDTVPHEDTVEWYETLCKRNASSVEFVKVVGLPVGTHIETGLGAATTQAREWLISLQDGTAKPVKGCSSKFMNG